MFKIVRGINHSVVRRTRQSFVNNVVDDPVGLRRRMESSVHTPDSEGFGPLLDRRGVDKLWMSEKCEVSSSVNFSDEGEKAKVFSRYIPESLNAWRRPEDKQASEDEPDIVRLGPAAIVRDAKLFKVESGVGEYVAIHTASSDTLIQLVRAHNGSHDEVFWDHIMSRAEYLCSTMSVKKIRLLLDAMSDARIGTIDHQKLRDFVHTLGRELLCQYHSLTAFSCASIATSLAKLKCRDPGTLNLLALAFEQNVSSPEVELEKETIVKYAIQMREAFGELEHAVPVLEQTVENILKGQPLVETRLGIQ